MPEFDCQEFLSPIESEYLLDEYAQHTLGAKIIKYKNRNSFPSLEDAQVVVLGVLDARGNYGNIGASEAADPIRNELYKLKDNFPSLNIIDIGNIKAGDSPRDSQIALSKVLESLLKAGKVTIILGGSHDLTYGQYLAYEKLEQTVNMVCLDRCFDIAELESELDSKTFLGHIILHQPNYLFNYSHIGYQNYFVGPTTIDLMHKLFFDVYRLGEIRANLSETEPILRNADMVSLDFSSLRFSDAQACAEAGPHGFYGEEMCKMLRYAGMSDKLSTVGFYEYNPELDNRAQGAQLMAQMVWHVIEGIQSRKKDFPFSNLKDYLKYTVELQEPSHSIDFYHSLKSGRWWMQVPVGNFKSKYQRHEMVPCSEKDYEQAKANNLPERWWQAFQKLV